MTYNTLAEVPTSELERHLSILERLRDRGDFADISEYWFYFGNQIPLLGDYSAETPDFEAEVLPVLEELVSRDVVR